MKNFLLTCLCSLIVAFSFGQDKSIKPQKPILKKNSIEAVEYLNKNLKLDAKQRSIVMNAFSEYANNMQKAIQKTSKSPDPKKVDSKKEVHKYMMRFATKRDAVVKECLKKKQVAKYDDFVRDIHPFTLAVRPKTEKKKN
tara:strand:+ start:732 stop:1151 length:420 start_codon:yes stop_codon:yes gene_type:complete